MRNLALTINGTPIPQPPNFGSQFYDLGSVVSEFLDMGFYIAAFLMVFWVFWGIFQYIFAGGNKDALANARKRITWALIGFAILGVLFGLSQYVQNIFPVSFHGGQNTIQTITPP